MTTRIERVERRSTSKDLSGQVFGALTVEAFLGYAVVDKGERRPLWECRCVCGSVVEVLAKYLQSGKKRSCGCGRAGASAAAAGVFTPRPDRPTKRETEALTQFWREREARRQSRPRPMEASSAWMA